MIQVVIEPQADLPTINVRIDETVSAEDIRATWRDVSSGLLQRQIRDAIGFECVKRGIDPREVIDHPPLN